MSGRPFTFWRVLPLIGEPASSYFSRLVIDECNHLPEMYASEVGVDTIFKSEELLERIFRLPISEADKERLRHWTPVERNGRIFLAGQTFRRNEFRWARRLECRHCIAEVPYHRVWWHLEFFRMCPVHQCSLEPIRHGQRSIGRWWPRYSHAASERLPHVELGDGEDTLESYVIRHLINRDGHSSEREVGDFIETAEVVGRLIGNPRQPTVPPFSKADLDLGYRVLNGGPSSIIEHFRAWMQANPPPPFAYRIRDLAGWADEYLLSQDRNLDPEVDDVANQLLLDVADIIRVECERVLGR
ncbi:hypothetical protein HGO34_15120 [Agrobacterium vitis]|nr:hypothetical protein [Agrobacterium vitis]